MVNGIGSYNNYMSYLQTQMPRSGPNPAEMFNKIDSDGSGGISQSELKTFAEGISSRTGNGIDTTNAISTYDTDGNGELSSDELRSFMEATMGPRRGMMGMQGGHGPENLFNALDSDGSGGISQSELDAFAADVSSRTGNSIDTTDAVSTYDTDGSGELSSDEFRSFMEATMPPPRGMMGEVGSTGTSSTSSAESVISAYDTNGDGVLSSDELQGYLDNTSTTSFMALMQQALSAYSMNHENSLFSNLENNPLNYGGFSGYSSFDFST
jgi:Ca2+-binding EF-hand superfamily protein